MSKQILLVDDDNDDHEIFSMAIREVNDSYQCVFAKDGMEALQLLKNDEINAPDIIFLDMNMPRMNGLECLPEIKKIEHLKHVPVIMYSTSSDSEIVNKVKVLGAAQYLVKPSSVKTLSQMLTQLFENFFSASQNVILTDKQ